MYKQKKMDSQQFYTDLFFFCWTLSLPWLQQQLRQQRLLQRALSVIKQSKPSSTGSILSSAIGFYASHATMLAAAVIGEWSSHSHNMVCNCCIKNTSFVPFIVPPCPPSIPCSCLLFFPFFLSPFLIFSLSLPLTPPPSIPCLPHPFQAHLLVRKQWKLLKQLPWIQQRNWREQRLLIVGNFPVN